MIVADSATCVLPNVRNVNEYLEDLSSTQRAGGVEEVVLPEVKHFADTIE